MMMEGTLILRDKFMNVLKARQNNLQSEWVPYRESTLTMYLEEFLSGNSRLIFVDSTSD